MTDPLSILSDDLTSRIGQQCGQSEVSVMSSYITHHLLRSNPSSIRIQPFNYRSVGMDPSLTRDWIIASYPRITPRINQLPYTFRHQSYYHSSKSTPLQDPTTATANPLPPPRWKSIAIAKLVVPVKDLLRVYHPPVQIPEKRTGLLPSFQDFLDVQLFGNKGESKRRKTKGSDELDYHSHTNQVSIPTHTHPLSDPRQSIKTSSNPVDHEYLQLVHSYYLPLLPDIPHCNTWIPLFQNAFSEDEPTLRYIPYYSDQEDMGIDYNDYFSNHPANARYEVISEVWEATVLCIMMRHRHFLPQEAVLALSRTFQYIKPVAVLKAVHRLVEQDLKVLVSSERRRVFVPYIGSSDEGILIGRAPLSYTLGSDGLLGQYCYQDPLYPSRCYLKKRMTEVIKSGSVRQAFVPTRYLLGLQSEPERQQFDRLVDNLWNLFCRRCFKFVCYIHSQYQPFPRHRRDNPSPFPFPGYPVLDHLPSREFNASPLQRASLECVPMAMSDFIDREPAYEGCLGIVPNYIWHRLRRMDEALSRSHIIPTNRWLRKKIVSIQTDNRGDASMDAPLQYALGQSNRALSGSQSDAVEGLEEFCQPCSPMRKPTCRSEPSNAVASSSSSSQACTHAMEVIDLTWDDDSYSVFMDDHRCASPPWTTETSGTVGGGGGSIVKQEIVIDNVMTPPPNDSSDEDTMGSIQTTTSDDSSHFDFLAIHSTKVGLLSSNDEGLAGVDIISDRGGGVAGVDLACGDVDVSGTTSHPVSGSFNGSSMQTSSSLLYQHQDRQWMSQSSPLDRSVASTISPSNSQSQHHETALYSSQTSGRVGLYFQQLVDEVKKNQVWMAAWDRVTREAPSTALNRVEAIPVVDDDAMAWTDAEIGLMKKLKTMFWTDEVGVALQAMNRDIDWLQREMVAMVSIRPLSSSRLRDGLKQHREELEAVVQSIETIASLLGTRTTREVLEYVLYTSHGVRVESIASPFHPTAAASAKTTTTSTAAAEGRSSSDVVLTSPPSLNLPGNTSLNKQQQQVRKKPTTSSPRSKLRNTSINKKIDNKSTKQFEPCDHEGICAESNPRCSCVRERMQCEKFCSCGVDCRNQFRGCVCRGGCKTKLCPCRAAGRSCDPDLCNKCGVSLLPHAFHDAKEYLERTPTLNEEKEYLERTQGNVHEGGDDNESVATTASGIRNYKACTNNWFEVGRGKSIAVGRSNIHGWGAFTLETVHPHEFIIEYVGEILSQEEADRRGKVYDRLGLNCLFRLNDETTLDATSRGNVAKFINHNKKEPNCYVKNMKVRSDNRIGIYAKTFLEVGTELTFDYGRDYKIKISKKHPPDK